MSSHPAYIESFRNGKLSSSVSHSFKMLESCCICPRRCGVNRLKDERGFCKTGLKPRVCSFMPHHGEEPPVSGSSGSGAIFFSYCNMSCVYCQNFQFSQLGEGKEVNFDELADFMLKLQNMGCHNINLVTPTHVMPQILKSLEIAVSKGLKIPLVYNTGGYELTQAIELLDGIVDIYLPDMRYGDPDTAVMYSNAPSYPKYNQQAVEKMHRQVGVADISDEGVLRRGLIIRHLVLPGNVSGAEKIMEFIARNISKDTYISLMSQYSPCFKTPEFMEISRRISLEEYEEAKSVMERQGLYNGWTQESCGLERFLGTNIKPAL